jgi:phospholipid-binding lipoprotein MlaA
MRYLVLLSLALGLSGCAQNATPLDPYDPYEDVNREIFEFNQALDAHVLEPAASVYSFVTPTFFRRGVDNFFSNASYPNVILNDFLQGKVEQGFADSGRFLLNTTVGVLGLWDPAKYVGLEEHLEDFGQTLAVWGVNSGPYIELPALGPTYARTLWDYPIAATTNVLAYAFEPTVTIPLTALYIINKRALLDKAAKIREQAALDPYLFTRTAYTQYRYNLIYDGNPPADDLYDESLFEDIEEEAEPATEPAR